MKARCLALCSILLLVGSLASPAHARAGGTVNEDRALLSFPESITFQASITVTAPVTAVVLEYGVRQLTCGVAVGKAFPGFAPGETVSVEWTWDMRQSGSQPPGAVIWWQWRVSVQGQGDFVTPQQTVTWLDDRHAWKVISGGDINLHWYRGDQDFSQELHASAVAALDRLAQDVGIRPARPVDLYIYADSQDMQDAILYEPSWTGGVAFAENSVVIIGISPVDIEWGKRTEAHELTHVLVGQLTFSCLGFIPTWLGEGLAMVGEGGLEAYDQASLDTAIADDTLMSIRSLSGGFSEEFDRASLAYAESYSIVQFLIDQFGQEQMTRLLEALRTGETVDAALQAVYGFDLDGLEDAWRAAIAAAPRLQVADPTPLPTPTIVPTYAPFSGFELAATPLPMPTAAAAGDAVSPPGGLDIPSASGGDWLWYLGIGLLCCLLVLFVVAVAVILILLRKKRSAP